MRRSTVRKGALGIVVGAAMLATSVAGASPGPLITDPSGDTFLLLEGMPEIAPPNALPKDAADLLSGNITFSDDTLRFSVRVVDLPAAGDSVGTRHGISFSHAGFEFGVVAQRAWAEDGGIAAIWLGDCNGQQVPVSYTGDTVVIEVTRTVINEVIAGQQCGDPIPPVERGSVFTDLFAWGEAYPVPAGLETNLVAARDHADAAPGTTYTVR
jgi:hypothetical protein